MRGKNGFVDCKHLKSIYRQSSRSVGLRALKGVPAEAGNLAAIMDLSGCGKPRCSMWSLELILPMNIRSCYGQRILRRPAKKSWLCPQTPSDGDRFSGLLLIESLNVQENIMVPMVLGKVDPQIMPSGRTNWQSRRVLKIFCKRIYEISGGPAAWAAMQGALIQKSVAAAGWWTQHGQPGSGRRSQYHGLLSPVKPGAEAMILMVTHDASAASFCGRVVFWKTVR